MDVLHQKNVRDYDCKIGRGSSLFAETGEDSKLTDVSMKLSGVADVGRMLTEDRAIRPMVRSKRPAESYSLTVEQKRRDWREKGRREEGREKRVYLLGQGHLTSPDHPIKYLCT